MCNFSLPFIVVVPIATLVAVANGYNTPLFNVQLVLIKPANRFALVIFLILPLASSNTYKSVSALVLIADCFDIDKSICEPVMDNAEPAVNPLPLLPIKSLYKIFFKFPFAS